MLSQHAARAYQAASDTRTLREQEADVFRRATASLRFAREAGPLAQARAVADNRRLWSLVSILVHDTENQLPPSLRAQIASIGIVVQRELDAPEPDIDFVMGVNDQMAAGLSGQI